MNERGVYDVVPRLHPEVCMCLEPECSPQPGGTDRPLAGAEAMPTRAAAEDGGGQGPVGRIHPVHRETLPENLPTAASEEKTLPYCWVWFFDIFGKKIFLQLSKFVEYTLACMKLPSLSVSSRNQPATKDAGPVTAVAADSTTSYQEGKDRGLNDDTAVLSSSVIFFGAWRSQDHDNFLT